MRPLPRRLSAPLFVWILLKANLRLGSILSLPYHPLGSVYTDVRYKSSIPSCFQPTLMPQGILRRVFLDFFFFVSAALA